MPEALNNVEDALAAVIEIYQDSGRQLPHTASRSEEM